MKESLKTNLTEARGFLFTSKLSRKAFQEEKAKQKFLCRRMLDKLDEGHRGHHTGAMWEGEQQTRDEY